ncbi:Npun_F0296 family exosortase-dependent surface protein [Sneathiella glossodoripedis]|uniref:Npun_F0296 family exosortase-dependent surface protein n=1 Tax=Sneathiella glossodoripedis TaxID=418853 RepID=UPI00046FA1E5|nr:hypothetical protein [Sneathiella glossodoripedis]
MNTLIKHFLAVMALTVVFASPARAATVSIITDDPIAALPVLTASATSGTVYQNVTGSVGGLRRSPWDTVSGLESSAYTSVSAGSWASYVFQTAMNTLTFMWGSVDLYNSIEFYNDGVLLNESIVGQDAINAGAVRGSDFVIATILTNGMFDEIRFLSGRNAFEYANVEVSAVPLPAALPLYGAGMALLGLLGWRKRRASIA